MGDVNKGATSAELLWGKLRGSGGVQKCLTELLCAFMRHGARYSPPSTLFCSPFSAFLQNSSASLQINAYRASQSTPPTHPTTPSSLSHPLIRRPISLFRLTGTSFFSRPCIFCFFPLCLIFMGHYILQRIYIFHETCLHEPSLSLSSCFREL